MKCPRQACVEKGAKASAPRAHSAWWNLARRTATGSVRSQTKSVSLQNAAALSPQEKTAGSSGSPPAVASAPRRTIIEAVLPCAS